MKQQLRKGLLALLRSGIRAGGERGRRLLAEAGAQGTDVLLEAIEPVTTPRGKMSFYCLGDIALWRARTLLTKEPETIEWIDSFANGDVFWDIGANVGVYSIYAAITRKIQVLAFEPSASNYLLLNRNIEINGLDNQLRSYCVAFNDVMSIDALNQQSTEFGGAMSSFAEAVDFEGRKFHPRFRQGMVGYSIDGFIAQFNPPIPNHLKIDVDGIEDRIVSGAQATLRDARLKSISIELEQDRVEYTASILDSIKAAGFELMTKRHAAAFDGGPYENVYNYLLRRTKVGAS